MQHLIKPIKVRLRASMPSGLSARFSFSNNENGDVNFEYDDGRRTIGSLLLDDVEATADKPQWMKDKEAYDWSMNPANPNANMLGLWASAVVSPGLNFMSPSQQWGAVREAEDFQDYWRKLGHGTSGIVTENFAQNHPYWSMAANLGLDVGTGALSPFAIKGLKTAVNGASNIPDIYYLTKLAHNTGTGLGNPFIREYLIKALQNPTLSRKFYTQMGSLGLGDFTIELMQNLYPRLVKLNETYGYSPRLDLPKFADNTLKMLEEGMPRVLKQAQFAKQLLSKIKEFNTVLGNIAEESPQYLQQIYNDLINGRINNIEDYVRGLVKQSGTFKRRMRLPEYSEDAFSTISGGKGPYTMDVGNDLVVDAPEMRYGNLAAVYIPKLDLLGDVSTWWSLRFPTFKDPSIKINTRGMHSGSPQIDMLGLDETILKQAEIPDGYINWVGSQFPKDYGTTYAHTVFKTPNKGASISDAFLIVPFTGLKDIKYSLGYKKGGKLIKKEQAFN